MKLNHVILLALLCAASIHICAEVIDCDKNPSKCPAGSYKNSGLGGCRRCQYNTQTKTLYCSCDEESERPGEYYSHDTSKSGCTAYKNDVYGHLDCE